MIAKVYEINDDLAMLGFFAKKRIYLDYAGATPVLPRAAHAVRRTFLLYANPSAIHADGMAAHEELTNARENLARHLGCKARELVFTSGATEGNNLATIGYVKRLLHNGRAAQTIHCITSVIEHPSVLACFDELESLGCVITRIVPDHRGIVTADVLKEHLKKNTTLVSIGWANSEIGVVQPIHALSNVIRAYEKENATSVAFHSDSGQAPLYMKTQVHGLGVDILTLDSGKLYGPRGIGAIFISSHINLASLLHGGTQESGLRPGTESVALAVGFADAYSQVAAEREKETARLRGLQNDFAQTLQRSVSGTIINTPLHHSLPHIVNFSVPGGYSGEYIALMLDAKGFSVSTKSACQEGNSSMSHVVSALGGDEWRVHNTVRVSFGRGTRNGHLHRLIAQIQTICARHVG